MRRQAKPFTVEIKRSKKSSGPSRSLFGLLDLQAETAEPADGDTRVLARPRSEAVNAARSNAEAALRAAKSQPAAPAKRILPDLAYQERVAADAATREAEAPVASEPLPRPRRPRKPTARAKEMPTALPIDVPEIVVPPAQPAPEPVPPAAASGKPAEKRMRLVRRRRGEDDTGRGERWKRRLRVPSR